MKKNAPALAACLALLCFIFAASLNVPAQQLVNATLSGRVSDPNGAVIPGLQITVTHKATSAQREAVTNDEGLFVLTSLPVGEYEVYVHAGAGFAAKRVSNVVLQVGQTANLDLTLDLADITETVCLDCDVNNRFLVNTTSPVIEGVISEREIESLPLNGRNFLELALLVPGNAPAPNFDPTKTNTVLISSAGQLGRGSNITIDGGDNNDDVVGGALINVTEDSVQEFQIATNRFSAELGRSASSVINVLTKQGTNALHGSASVFWRDRRLQGLPATFDRRGAEPPFDREQYSFTLGGPVKRDKAWFFGAFEYRNQDGAVLVGERDAATRSIRRGFADAPLNDLLASGRLDWSATDTDRLGFRYSLERADDVTASTLVREIGSASQRQAARNNYQALVANWSRVLSPRAVNDFRFGVNNFFNRTAPLTVAPQFTFPSLQDGASFRVPQATRQNRVQASDNFSFVAGNHTLRFGGDFQRIDADFDLGVFRQGRIEFVEDFPTFDHNGDGRTDDNDLLFAVTLRSGVPERALVIPDADNNHFAVFAQDDWRVSPRLTLNLGLRYELDTDVKNLSRTAQLNPLILPFLHGERGRDTNNFAPRVGFNFASADGTRSLHGGYGIYYDRVVLQIQSLERGLDGRALPVEVRAGNVFFLDPQTGQFPPFAPSFSNPFTGFILPGAGASGINIIDNDLQNPSVQQMNLGIQQEFARDFVVRADYVHNFGTHFLIGRTIGAVFNPVVGGPDRVVNLESSAKFKYDALLLSLEKRYSNRYLFRASYTLSKAFNYANDDQIPFSNGPIDPTNLQLEYGPTPNDQRHRFTFAGTFDLPYHFRLAPILTLASAVPLDILLPDASTRIPQLQRNAGGRLFRSGAELNAFLNEVNAAGGVNGQLLPLAPADARFGDNFSSLDLRASRTFRFNESVSLEPIIEVFNLFNVTNVLGVSNVNYSGYGNVLGSQNFGRPVTTAGGVFGSGGPRAFQFAARFKF